MNQQRCCILGICCPPGSAGQIAALAEYLAQAAGYDESQAALETGPMFKAAAKLLSEFKIRSE